MLKRLSEIGSWPREFPRGKILNKREPSLARKDRNFNLTIKDGLLTGNLINNGKKITFSQNFQTVSKRSEEF